MTVGRLGLEGKVRSILVRGIVTESELYRTAIHAVPLAVCAREAVKPSNATEELTLDGGRALRVAVCFVEEDGVTGLAVVGHLWRSTLLV